MNIISYTTSGLGNRLRPLAACYAISKSCDRKLQAYWDQTTFDGCLADFNELFENELQTITLEQMEQLKDCAVFSEGGAAHSAEKEYFRFGRESLKKLGAKYGLRDWNSFNSSCNNENVIIYHNNFLPNVDINLSLEYIRSLKPTQQIREKIDEQSELLKLNRNVVGIHARGTDFDIAGEKPSITPYIEAMNQVLAENPWSTFFLSTEDKAFETEIREKYGSKVKVYEKDFYRKEDPDKGWAYNFKITKSHAQDAVVDMFLLAKTDIRIFRAESTFCEIARILANGAGGI